MGRIGLVQARYAAAPTPRQPGSAQLAGASDVFRPHVRGRVQRGSAADGSFRTRAFFRRDEMRLKLICDDIWSRRNELKVHAMLFFFMP